MSVIESGAAVNVTYAEHETRAVAIHEAGHAAAAHATGPRSSRAGSRSACARAARSAIISRFAKRGALHAVAEREFGDLIHILGAMAAEHVFYGQNAERCRRRPEHGDGTRGDDGRQAGMGPQPIDLNGSPRRRARGGGEAARRHREARRADRAAADEPHARRRRLPRRPDRVDLQDPFKRQAPRRSSARRIVIAVQLHPLQQGQGGGRRRRPRREGARSTATS